jgi:hypothetical protein
MELKVAFTTADCSLAVLGRLCERFPEVGAQLVRLSANPFEGLGHESERAFLQSCTFQLHFPGRNVWIPMSSYDGRSPAIPLSQEESMLRP